MNSTGDCEFLYNNDYIEYGPTGNNDTLEEVINNTLYSDLFINSSTINKIQ